MDKRIRNWKHGARLAQNARARVHNVVMQFILYLFAILGGMFSFVWLIGLITERRAAKRQPAVLVPGPNGSVVRVVIPDDASAFEPGAMPTGTSGVSGSVQRHPTNYGKAPTGPTTGSPGGHAAPRPHYTPKRTVSIDNSNAPQVEQIDKVHSVVLLKNGKAQILWDHGCYSDEMQLGAALKTMSTDLLR